mgnify:CR=1 FL=1
MPYHSSMKKKDGNPKKKVAFKTKDGKEVSFSPKGKKGGKKMEKKKLTESQEKKLKDLRKSHTPKHLSAMKKFLLEGKTFKQAHDLATKEVGK